MHHPSHQRKPLNVGAALHGRQAGPPTGIILTSEDIDADHATLRSRGVDTDPEVQRWGAPVPPMFSFRDGDGNALMVVENG